MGSKPDESFFAKLFAPEIPVTKDSSIPNGTSLSGSISPPSPPRNYLQNYNDDIHARLGLLHDAENMTLEEEVEMAKMQRARAPIEQQTKPMHSPVLTKIDSDLNPLPIVDEYEEADFGDTYDNYVPSKLPFGQPHPDPIVESSSLSVVSPPDIRYQLSLPTQIISEGLLSSLQLESVVYACQKHEDFLPDGSRAGYLIGDGPGVGKGRIIAGIIFENFLHGRTKALWVSVSNDLKFDAARDLDDISCDVHVASLNKISYDEPIDELFEEYNDRGVVFSTYSSLIGEPGNSTYFYKSRFDQLFAWLTPTFDGLIIFDECHKAKNLLPSGSSKSTKTARYVLNIQQRLPKARIIYCSATGASEPRNMAYMTRLGLWGSGTPFTDFEAFLSAVEKRGVGAMELVAIDMKQRGVYLARQLSFSGVLFSVKEVSLSKSFKEAYDQSVEFWEIAHTSFDQAAELMGYSAKERTSLMAQFFASHQRFFKSLCISSKVESIVAITKQALCENKAVIIGLQSTGESKSSDVTRDRPISKIVSTSHGILHTLVSRHFPSLSKISSFNNKSASSDDSIPIGGGNDFVAKKRKISEIDSPKVIKRPPSSSLDSIFGSIDSTPSRYDWNFNYSNPAPFDPRTQQQSGYSKCQDMANELMAMIDRLSPLLPPNTLDDLIDKLGGPNSVAEMTGRKSRFVRISPTSFIYQSRASEDVTLDLVNVHERDSFMDGRKLIAIISEAASSGISLQSDRRVDNKRKRLHITLELSWSADRAVQQFGRSHRSNQAHPPEYLFVISELAGEKRFACVVAKRLESLGALTHGDRRASDTRDLSQFNIDTKYGRYALDKMYKVFINPTKVFVELPPYNGDFLADAAKVVDSLFKCENVRGSESKDRDSSKIHKFLNRLLGVRVDLQNAIYQFYTSILENFVKEAKSTGNYDFGIVDLGLGNDLVVEKSRNTFSLRSSSGFATAELIEFLVERGIGYMEAFNSLSRTPDPKAGFYISKEARGLRSQFMLVLPSSTLRGNSTLYTASRPNTGYGKKAESFENLTKNYIKVDPNQAAKEWNSFYEATYAMCIHQYFFGSCKALQRNGSCDVGKRVKTLYLLCGAIFCLWNVVECTFGNSPVRMARVVTQEKERRIGIIIPKFYMPRLESQLEKIPK